MLLGSFLLSLNAIFSIFFTMAVGYGAKRMLHLDKEHVGRFNTLAFYTLLPMMLFLNIYQSNLRGSVSPRSLGLALNLSGLRLPAFLMTPIGQLGASASPVALLLLGAQFEFRDVRLHRRNLAICAALRLLVYPAAALILAALAGLRGPEYAVLISMFATPTAVSSFSMAAQMGGDADLAASAVTVTTVLSAGTLFLWIFLSKYPGMF